MLLVLETHGRWVHSKYSTADLLCDDSRILASSAEPLVSVPYERVNERVNERAIGCPAEMCDGRDMSQTPPVAPHPAATVILLRERRDGYEVLLVRRNERLSFQGGAWVFPGGRIDAADYRPVGLEDILAAARQAAVREVKEEVGLTIELEPLLLISRWITPEVMPKRFDTWFFVTRASGSDEVRIDHEEIHDHCWMTPEEAIRARAAGQIVLPAPTFVTLMRLSRFERSSDVLNAHKEAAVETFLPRIRLVERGHCSLYPGDAAYDEGDVDRPGPRHRLWMLDSEWRYERTA